MKPNRLFAVFVATCSISGMAHASRVVFSGNTALSADQINAVTVAVELRDGVYKPLPKNAAGGVPLAGIDASKLSDDAIVTLLRAVSAAYQAQGIFATQAIVTGADYGKFKGGANLTVKIVEHKIAEVNVVPAQNNKDTSGTAAKSVAGRETEVAPGKEEKVMPGWGEAKLWPGTEERVKSAIAVAPGDLVDMGRIDEGINLLNRHPRRYIEPYLRDDDGRLVLEYRVNQLNPYAARVAMDTYGTNSGGELRFSGAFDYYDLIKQDDRLSLLAVSDFDLDTWALASSFGASFDPAGIWKGSLSATLSSYDASQLGLGSLGNDFSGNTWSAGGDLTYTAYNKDTLFVDLLTGVRWMHVTQDSSSVGIPKRDTDFLLLGLGVTASSLGRDRWWSVGARADMNLPDVANTLDDGIPLDQMGRSNTSRDFTYLAVNGLYGQYIDSWFGENRRAYEISFNGTAFSEITDERLPPTFLDIIGGGDNVRGYPKAVASGDYGVFLSSNFTVHLPRLIGIGPPTEDTFRHRPRFAGDYTDWDFAVTAFVDYGYVASHQALPSEDPVSLVSTGIALSYSFKDQFRANLSLGIPLQDVTSGRESVEVGDTRIDMGVSINW